MHRLGQFAHFCLAVLPFTLTGLTALWFLQQSPFSTPLIDRTPQQIEAVITRAMARQVDVAWLLPRLQDAVISQDLMQLELLLRLAADHAIALPPALIEDANAVIAAHSGLVTRGIACGACALDITACQTVSQIGACAIPFELTPAGDLNALRRAGMDYANGDQIDRLDVGLALVGLGATGAVVASGGTSYTLKAGTALIRMARRLGTLTPAMTAQLSALITDAVRWDRFTDLARGRVGPQDLVDQTRLNTLSDLGVSLQRVADDTSVASMVGLMRHLNTPADAARLARVSTALGPRTQGAFEVLGATRVFRATVRISNLALGAAAAIYVFLLQICIFAAQQGCNACLRAMARPRRRKI